MRIKPSQSKQYKTTLDEYIRSNFSSPTFACIQICHNRRPDFAFWMSTGGQIALEVSSAVLDVIVDFPKIIEISFIETVVYETGKVVTCIHPINLQ